MSWLWMESDSKDPLPNRVLQVVRFGLIEFFGPMSFFAALIGFGLLVIVFGGNS